MQRRHALASLIMGAITTLSAVAQTSTPDFPSRALRLVVPYPAGGGTDIVARPIPQRVAEALGKPVVVENKPGASGLLGTDAVAKSAGDGHTLLFTVTTPVVMSLYTYNKLPYRAGAATPKPIVARLSAEIAKALKAPATTGRAGNASSRTSAASNSTSPACAASSASHRRRSVR